LKNRLTARLGKLRIPTMPPTHSDMMPPSVPG